MQQQVILFDDVRDAFGEVISQYQEREDVRDGAIRETLDRVSESLDGFVVAAADEDDSESAVGSAVVMLDSQQWADVQRCWGWAKSGLSAGLFLSLLCAVLLAALLGTRLWAEFARGWRR